MTPLRRWQSVAIAFIAAATLSSAGCNLISPGTTTGGKGNTGNTGDPVPGQVTLTPTILSYGNVTVGGTKSLQLTLTNSSASGGPKVTVSKVSITGSDFTNNLAAPVDLSPGQSVNLSVKFTPSSSGAKSGRLVVDVAGADDPGTVPMYGTGLSTAVGSLAISPSTLSFGSVNIGASKNLAATLTASTADVNVSSAAWTGSGYSLSGITFPVTIQSGKSVSFTVTFAPPSSGNLPGNVSFASDATDSPVKATFSGTGVQTGKQHIVSLSWSPSSSQVIGYNIYRGTQSGGPYTRLNSSPQPGTSYSDATVSSGKTYFYSATSVSSNSAESTYSAEVVAVIPTP